MYTGSIKRSATDVLDVPVSSSEGASDPFGWERAAKALCVFSWQLRRIQTGHVGGRLGRCGSDEGTISVWERGGSVSEGGLGAIGLSEERA